TNRNIRPPITTPLPYTTLFRSHDHRRTLTLTSDQELAVAARHVKKRHRDQSAQAAIEWQPAHAPAILNVGEKIPVRRNRSFGKADRKSTRLNSSHLVISYAVFC